MFIYLRNPVDIIQHSPQDSVFTYLQQWLREVLSQLSQSRGIPRSYYNILHVLPFHLFTFIQILPRHLALPRTLGMSFRTQGTAPDISL